MQIFSAKSADRLLSQQAELLRAGIELRAQVGELLARVPAAATKREPGAGSALAAARAEVIHLRATIKAASETIANLQQSLTETGNTIAHQDREIVSQSETIKSLRETLHQLNQPKAAK